jgi:DNA repair protein RadC
MPLQNRNAPAISASPRDPLKNLSSQKNKIKTMKPKTKKSKAGTVNTVDALDRIGIVDVVYKKIADGEIADRPVITNSKDAYTLCLHHWNKDKIELLVEAKVLFLNRAKNVMELYHLSHGGISATLADIRIIMAAALQLSATSMILVHNHPSGNLTPSRATKTLARCLKDAALLFDITLEDCLIITHKKYYSFADNWLI